MTQILTTIPIAGCRLPVQIEQVNDSYQLTSPKLEGLLVLADTFDEALALAPDVARALLVAMQDQSAVPPLPDPRLRLD